MENRRSGTALVFTLSLLSVAVAAAQIPETVEPSEIPNYRVVRPGLATAGQPSPEALQKLKAQGFKTVINLRTAAEGAPAGKESLEAQGIRYVWVPISPATFSLADVQAVAKVLDDPEASPVLLHCASANRVGGVWTVIQVQKGSSLAEAEAEGRQIGLSSAAMIEATKRVAAEASARK